MEIFWMNQPLEVEEEKYMIDVTSLEFQISVFKTNEQNNFIIIYTSRFLKFSENIASLEKSIGQRSSNQKKLQVEEINKRRLEKK